jgi:NAD(P)H-nitrite reductase large subunit
MIRTMKLDDELCLCFHVTRRKVINYLRIEKPKKVAQLSDCFGAGTGCGWCRPLLQKLFEQAQQGNEKDLQLPAAEECTDSRTQYVLNGGGTPPAGATPINE